MTYALIASVVYPPLRETFGLAVGRLSGSHSSDGGDGIVMADGRVRLKQGVYYTLKLVYKLVNRYLFI